MNLYLSTLSLNEFSTLSLDDYSTLEITQAIVFPVTATVANAQEIALVTVAETAQPLSIQFISGSATPGDVTVISTSFIASWS